jgi:hypothetical protein
MGIIQESQAPLVGERRNINLRSAFETLRFRPENQVGSENPYPRTKRCTERRRPPTRQIGGYGEAAVGELSRCARRLAAR